MSNAAPAETTSHRAIRACVTLCCVLVLTFTSLAQAAVDTSPISEDTTFEMSGDATPGYSLVFPVNVDGKRIGSNPSATGVSIAEFQGLVVSLPFRSPIAIERPAQLDPTPP